MSGTLLFDSSPIRITIFIFKFFLSYKQNIKKLIRKHKFEFIFNFINMCFLLDFVMDIIND